jgi:hypothetical protein
MRGVLGADGVAADALGGRRFPAGGDALVGEDAAVKGVGVLKVEAV